MSLFTPENAAEMARRSADAKKKRLEDLRLAVEIAVKNPVIDFAGRSLSRVRLQMERLADEIDEAITGDSKRLKELTDAYSRLADQERILSNRPLPGSRRPAPERKSKESSSIQPID